jgi:seryl-tRNA synthetase
MIDIQYIRDNPKEVEQSIARRGLSVNIHKLLTLDKKRRELLTEVEALRAQLKLSGKPTAAQLKKLQTTKRQHEKLQEEYGVIDKEYTELLAQVPNLLAENTPDGGEENNRQERKWGKTKLTFTAKDHMQLNEIHDLFNFEAGAKVAGAKFYFLKDRAVRLWQAIQMYAQDVVREEGFELMSVPHLVNFDIADGTGYMPRGEENQNYIDEQQKLVLIATSELPLTGYYKDDIVDVAEPKMYAATSPCYRLEAGTYGKFSKGLYRTHQFEKLEMYIFCQPDQSTALLKKIIAIEERICKGLEIPYRLVRIAAGDMSAPAYEKYDIEYWSPPENEYRELTSCSNCTDYQARNLNIRFRNADGKLEFVHTLNGTAAVSSRAPIAILENHQQKDGSIKIPKVLQKYYGAAKL